MLLSLFGLLNFETMQSQVHREIEIEGFSTFLNRFFQCLLLLLLLFGDNLWIFEMKFRFDFSSQRSKDCGQNSRTADHFSIQELLILIFFFSERHYMKCFDSCEKQKLSEHSRAVCVSE